MLEIANVIFPVFIVMAIGFTAVKSGYLSSEISENLNALTVKIAVPLLLFQAISQLDFSNALRWPVLASFYIGAVCSFFISMIIAKSVFKRPPGQAVAVGFCALFSNTVLLGVPIAQRAFGLDIMPLVFGIIAFHAPGLYILGIFSMEFARSDGHNILKTIGTAIRSIFANSLMIAILFGAFFNLLGISLPAPLESAVDMVATAAIPMALIGIGAALTQYEIKAELSETAVVSVISLIIHPAIAFLISHVLLDLPKQFVQAAVIIAAMPPGMNIYIFALMYNRAVALSASAILVATLGSFFTISAWLVILSRL